MTGTGAGDARYYRWELDALHVIAFAFLRHTHVEQGRVFVKSRPP